VDRRVNRDINCSKTIWILACNLGDEAIASFYESKLAQKQEKEKLIADLEPLIRELRDAFKERWGVWLMIIFKRILRLTLIGCVRVTH
jgi:ATP-dependent Clp protease ATP-binding subunit ClpA